MFVFLLVAAPWYSHRMPDTTTTDTPVPTAPDGSACPACAPCADLPSSNSAHRFVNGDLGAGLYVLRDWGVRAGMGAFGAWVGAKVARTDVTFKQAVVAGMAMSAVIEGFVLTYQAVMVPKNARTR